MKISIVILAAGHGTRMCSDIPKVLHKIAEFSMLEHVMHSALSLAKSNVKISDVIIVVSENLERHSEFNMMLATYTDRCNIKTIVQQERLGTGHAAWIGLCNTCTSKSDAVLVMYGDTPLFTDDTLARLVQRFSIQQTGVIGTAFEHHGNGKYGRLQFDINDNLIGIIEANDIAIQNENVGSLCNAGMLIADYNILNEFLNEKCTVVGAQNGREIYITDLFAYAAIKSIANYILVDESEALGVNSREELVCAEALMQNRFRKQMMQNGVTLLAPETVFFAADTQICSDTIVYPYVRFGRNVNIGKRVEVRSFCDIEGVSIGNEVVVGPFARIRSNTSIGDNCKIGNFVELKNAALESDVKASHLSYIGDASIGQNTNIGAGTIFCNYDGIQKHNSVVGNNTLIGANTSLIAPVHIGNSAIIGAGSVIIDDVMDNELSVARAKQINKQRKTKN